MKNPAYYRYDIEELREYTGYTVSAVVFLFAAGIGFASANYFMSAMFGVLGLIFTVSVVCLYHDLIQTIDEIEGFFVHFGLIYFLKFALCFVSGISLARQQYLECIAGVCIIAVLSVMLIYGYRDMLREKCRIEAGEYTFNRLSNNLNIYNHDITGSCLRGTL